MKFDELRSIAHNIADSLASGVGLMIGIYDMDVFREARRSPERFMTVDFLAGACREGTPSKSLAKAIALYKVALADLCIRHGASISAFRELTVRYSGIDQGRCFVVTIEDDQGRRCTDEYVGFSGRRPMLREQSGRIRRKPPVKTKR